MSTESPYRTTCPKCADLERMIENKNLLIEKLGLELESKRSEARWKWFADNIWSLGLGITALASFAFLLWVIHHKITEPAVREPEAPVVCIESVAYLNSKSSSTCPRGGKMTTEVVGSANVVVVHCSCPTVVVAPSDDASP